MKKPKNHVCWETEKFEVYLSPYPFLVFRCPGCRHPVRYTPLDDVDGWLFDVVTDMINRYRRNRRDGNAS